MTAKELAQRLDGREYGNVVTRAEQDEIEAAGLVVAYGQSDSLLEFEGAIYNEAGAYGGATVYVKNGALLAPPCDCESWDECSAWDEYSAKAKAITAVWHGDGETQTDTPCWTIKTDIPHETFRIYDDGELFSVGIVFRVKDTWDKPSADQQLRDLQTLLDMYGGEEGIAAAFQKAAERDAAVEELRGLCWCCVHGEKWAEAPVWSKAITCEHMRESGTLARGGGKCKCPHWKWRGPQKKEAAP